MSQNLHITDNPREITLKGICQLADTIGTLGFFVASVILTSGKGKPNAAKTIENLPDYDAKAKYTILGKRYTGQEIVDAVAKAESVVQGEVPAVVEGRRRILAVIILNALRPELDIIANTLEVGAEQASRVAYEGNRCNEYTKRLATMEKVRGIIPLIKDGTYKAQGECGGKPGENQLLWYAACLVIEHGISLEDVSWLDKEQCRKAYTGEFKKEKLPGTVISRVADYVAEEKANEGKGNKPKPMAGDEIRAKTEMALTLDPTASHPMTKCLMLVRDNMSPALGEHVRVTLTKPATAEQQLTLVTAIEVELDAAKKRLKEMIDAEKAVADAAVAEAQAAQDKAAELTKAAAERGKVEVAAAQARNAERKNRK